MRARKDADEYKFLQFKDVHTCINQRVNLIGIIVEYGLPKSTRGTDYCCTIRIVDETHHQSSMAVNIFAEKVESLPHVASGGDVILLCHVTIKKYAEEVNVVFNKKFSSFALYKGDDEGNNGDDFVPYQVSSNFHPREENKMLIVKLRKWLVNFQPCEDSRAFPLLREIKGGEHLNLACKILKCCEVVQDKWFIYVWDGTDAPPNAMCSKPEDELNSPLPLQLEPLPLPRDLYCTFPAVGSILRITFDQVIVKDPLHFLVLDSIKWVRFVNLRVEVFAGLWFGVFTPYTKLQYTPNKDCLILERQRLFDERRSLRSGRMPYWSLSMPLCVTDIPVEYDHVGHVTLMDVLSHSQVTAKFICVVRVVAALPCHAEDFRCPTAGVYRMRLTLEDPTARIHAFVYAEDGETLFDGYPSIDNLTKKLNKLLGVTERDDSVEGKHTPRNPPWVRMCLKSYYIDPTDKWGSRQFRIFDTKIAGEA